MKGWPPPLDSVLGKVVRMPLRAIPRSTAMPVVTGPLRGKRWIVGSSTSACWLGTYERDKVGLLQQELAPGDVFFDIGAHAGYFALLGSMLVGDAGKVVAFEPLPRNLRFLHEHLRRNRIRNVRVVEAAVADAPGEERFLAAGDSHMGHLSPEGTVFVRTVTIDGLLSTGELAPPTCLKIDVEGGELAVLRGAEQVIRASRPTVFLATHGRPLQRACREVLAEWGYEVRPIGKAQLDRASELLARSQAGDREEVAPS